jgi:hypothetical protein
VKTPGVVLEAKGKFGLPKGFSVEMWEVGSLRKFIKAETLKGDFVSEKAKNVTEDFDKATAILAAAELMFNTTLGRLNQSQRELVDGTKKVSTAIRKATDELGQGMQRLDKAIDPGKLERYVGLLERAAVALQQLADLQRDGKLDKVINAIK